MFIHFHFLSRPRALVAALAAAGVIPAHAQTTVLPETVVTASRVVTPTAQVGSAISVVTGEQLDRQQTRIVSDALRAVPGVTVGRGGPVGALSEIRIRGAESNHTLVLIDGIEANDPSFSSIFDFAHLLATDIDRIEVLRGPQSALWGSDAIGGVINIVTPRGQGPATATVTVEGGSFGTGLLSGNTGGGDEQFNYYVGASRYVTAGESVSPTGSEDDGYRNSTFSFKTGFQPTPLLAFDVVGRYVAAEVESDPQDFAFPPTPTYGDIIDGNNVTDVEQLYARAQGTLTLFDGAWEQRFGVALTDADNDIFEEGRQTTATNGRKLKYDYQSSVFFGSATAFHTLTLALEHEQEEFSQRGDSPDAPQNQDQDIDTSGVIGEYRLDLNEQLFLSGSLRYDDNDRFADETTYRLTAAYLLPASGTRLHASYGTGVKNPTFTELFGFFPGSFVGNPDLEPEKSRGYDLGVEQTFLDGRAAVDVTFFDTNLEDELITVFDPDTFVSTAENQSGDSERRGVEISARAALTPELGLVGSYTYTDSQDPDGADEVRRPSHTASLNLNYQPNGRTLLNLGADYVGEQDDLDFGSFPSERVTLDSYTLVSLRGSYQVNETLRLFGRVENLLDEDYQDVFGYATTGIGVFAGVEGSW